MRTGGDDIAQALALIGARPVWEPASGRVTGFEILPASILDRPRVDVTRRISGFFRDAFPGLIDLFDSAARAIAALDEPESINPLASRYAVDRDALETAGAPPEEAARRAGYRIFGAKPGAYGAGLQTMIDERIWDGEGELADAWLGWGQYAYAAGGDGKAERGLLETRLGAVDAVLHNQDNREHDLLDSDDYYQFEGGLALVVRHLSGKEPVVYHNDHSVPEHPRIRTLREELGRVVRGRAANPRATACWRPRPRNAASSSSIPASARANRPPRSAWCCAASATACGLGWCSSSRAPGAPASATYWRNFPLSSPAARWARASPGTPKTASATSPPRAPRGRRRSK